jgi:chlorite dismutase
MDTHPYHHYLFFDVSPDFYQLPMALQNELKMEFEKVLVGSDTLIIATYATLGFKARATFMLWCRGKNPSDAQNMLRDLLRTKFGKYLTISYTYFGIVRNSEYSGRTGKPEQVMQTYNERLLYFVLYPFTKTSEWHAMDFESRRAIMGEHVKVGLSHREIRQCLLYSYGVDDYEFLVSYEMKTLEEFQDLVIEMRRTAGRKYTLVDTPTFTCIYKTAAELMAWI